MIEVTGITLLKITLVVFIFISVGLSAIKLYIREKSTPKESPKWIYIAVWLVISLLTVIILLTIFSVIWFLVNKVFIII